MNLGKKCKKNGELCKKHPLAYLVGRSGGTKMWLGDSANACWGYLVCGASTSCRCGTMVGANVDKR